MTTDTDNIVAAIDSIRSITGFGWGAEEFEDIFNKPYDASIATILNAVVAGKLILAPSAVGAAAPDLLELTATLADALEAERKRAEKAETERDVYKEISVNLQIERVQDLARLAVAYNTVANIARSYIYYDSAGSGFREDEFNDAILALTTTNTENALNKMLSDVRAEGWRAGRDAAAKICDDTAMLKRDPAISASFYVVAAVIRDLPEPKENNHD